MIADAPMPDAVVTGATGGVGRWIALGVAQAGFRVFLVGRDPARLAAARAWIDSRVPGAADRIVPIEADLSLLAQTRGAVARITGQTGAIALLVNNAGIFSSRPVLTAEGHERTLAVNHLSPFVLTQGLLPALRQAPGRARIVNVGSSTADHGRLDPDNLAPIEPFAVPALGPLIAGVRAYSRSKLALLMASLALGRRLEGSSVCINVVHPGTVASGLVRERGVVGLAWKAMAPFLLTEREGADTPLYAALAAESEGLSGCYLKRRRPVRPNRQALDPESCERVLATTERLSASRTPRG